MPYIIEKPAIAESRFLIKRELGRGGMGVVYEAHDTEKDVSVALKTLLHFHAEDIYRLKKEFRSLQDIVHPNLCSLGELVEENGKWAFIMELIQGVDFLTYNTKSEHSPANYFPTQQRSVNEGVVHESTSYRGFDEYRLRNTLRGVVDGLVAIHSAGKVHRDIKPSNVLVTPEGRPVLLDFGLIIETGDDHKSTMGFAGTPEYMAPEQAESPEVGPAADWYALGVMLYEVLTGTLPFRGTTVQVLVDKTRKTPAPISSLVRNVPGDLESLCTDLLRIDPASRPSGEEVLRRLGLNENSEPSTRTTGLHPNVASQIQKIVGREEELSVLHRGFRDTMAGAPVTVVVEGVSGVGKSTLLDWFRRDLYFEYPETVFLSGRCYERETVPFKAFDGVVDTLAKYIQRLPDVEAAKLMPRNVTLLARLFPTLNLVKTIAQEPPPRYEIVDPHEMQRRSFGALRDMFLSVTERYPLVVSVDDMQWTDSDSLLLLDEILRIEDGPPMLLLLSSRYIEGEKKSVLDWRSKIPGELRRIQLESLGRESSFELANLCLEKIGGNKTSITAAEIAAEAGGHPLYISELVRYATEGGKSGLAELRLDDMIWDRVEQLPISARRVLEYSCVVGAPIKRENLRQISRLDENEFTKSISLLRVANLLRGTGERKKHPVEPYHDRVREAVLAHLVSRDKAAELHLEIGRFFLRKYLPWELEENIFEVTGHLNEGQSFITDEKEKERLLEINFTAGKKARDAAAYASALEHFLKSIELSSLERWEQQYDDMLALYISSAEAAYLQGDFDLTTRLVNKALEHARTVIDRAKVFEIHLSALIGQGKPIEAIDEALGIIRQLGVKLPSRPNNLDVLLEIALTSWRLKGKTRKELLNMPVATDSAVIAAKQLMALLGTTAYFHVRELWPIIAMEAIHLSLKYGNDHVSSIGYGAWGVMNCALLNRFNYGYEMGLLSLEISDRFEDKSKIPMVVFVFAVFVQHWKDHLKETLSYILDSYNRAVEIGDLLYMGHSAVAYCTHSYFLGMKLSDVSDLLERFGKAQRQANYHLTTNTTKIFHQAVLNLRGRSSDPSKLIGEIYDENCMLQSHIEADEGVNLFDYHFNILILSYMFGQPENAFGSAEKVRKYAETQIGTFAFGVFHFWESLACLACCQDKQRGLKRKRLGRVAANQKKMKRWARHAPANYLHKYRLIEAERARIKGNINRAPELYDQSIKGALENAFTQDAALACELAGHFYLGINDRSNAERYLKEAHLYYTRWGAVAKVKEMEERYPLGLAKK